MLSSGTKIDPRVRRTRKLLLDAFLGLLREKPFEEITVQNITDRATVNRATFYAHFVDKYALVDDLIREGFAAILQQRLQTPTTNAQEHLRRLFLAVTDHWIATHAQCQQGYRLFESLVEAQVKAQVRDSVCAWFVEYKPTRVAHQNRLELAATIVSWAIYGAAKEWTKQRGVQTAEAFADTALPLIAASIAALDDRLRYSQGQQD